MWSPCLLVKMKLVSVVNKLKTGNRSRETDTCHLREFRSGPGREVAAVWLARPAAPSAASRRDKRPTLSVSPLRGADTEVGASAGLAPSADCEGGPSSRACGRPFLHGLPSGLESGFPTS